MQRLIDANKLENEINQFDYYDQVKNAPTVLAIPEQPTNGDIQKALYPNAKIMRTNDSEIGLRLKEQNWIIWFKEDWWNAPWKNTKGD